jgi:hypothetical protein
MLLLEIASDSIDTTPLPENESRSGIDENRNRLKSVEAEGITFRIVLSLKTRQLLRRFLTVSWRDLDERTFLFNLFSLCSSLLSDAKYSTLMGLFRHQFTAI